MSIRLCCANGHDLEVPDRFTGTSIVCPTCGLDVHIGTLPPAAELVIEPAPPPYSPAHTRPLADDRYRLASEDSENQPSSKRRLREQNGPGFGPVSKKMRLLTLGLNCFYVKFLLIVVVFFLLAMPTFDLSPKKPQTSAGTLALLQVLTIFAESGLGLAGSFFCRLGSRKSRLRSLAGAAMVLEAAALPGAVAGGIIAGFNSETGTLIALLGFFFSLAAMLTFMIFMSNLARHLHEETAAEETMQLLYMMFALYGCALILGGLVAILFVTGAGPALVFLAEGRERFGIFLGVAVIGIHVKFALGMLRVFAAMRRHISSGSRSKGPSTDREW